MTQFCVPFQLPFGQIKCGFPDKRKYLLFTFIPSHFLLTPHIEKILSLAGHLLSRRVIVNVFNRMTDDRMFYLLFPSMSMLTVFVSLASDGDFDSGFEFNSLYLFSSL